jgi:tRNA-dihydrouridine synthase
VAKYVEDNGADAITVHGRTREQMFSPPVNLDIKQR